MDEELIKCEVKKIAAVESGSMTFAAVFLETSEKTFVIFIGASEAHAMVCEIQNQQPVRPLTHDLIYNILLGFDVEIKKVIISNIVNDTFCATLILQQEVKEENKEWTGKRNEVYIDARASDSIVMALKSRKDIWVTRKVLDGVKDVSDQLAMMAQQESKEWEGTELDLDLNKDNPEPDEDEGQDSGPLA